jgi:protease YdgD
MNRRRTFFRRIALAAILSSAIVAACMPATGRAGESVAAKLPPPSLLQPGIGAHDPRARIDPGAAPWRGVGKLQAATGNLHMGCTGSLLGPATVLTAAHCVFNPRTRQYFPPSSLHFLVGFESGGYAAHAGVVRIVTGPGYDPADPHRTPGSDWALLTLAARIGTPDRILPIREQPPAIGATVMVGGYSRDHALVLTADSACRIIGEVSDRGGRKLLHHNCTGTHGVSGAPVLVRDGSGWSIGGIAVSGEMGVASGYAVILDEARKHL